MIIFAGKSSEFVRKPRDHSRRCTIRCFGCSWIKFEIVCERYRSDSCCRHNTALQLSTKLRQLSHEQWYWLSIRIIGTSWRYHTNGWRNIVGSVACCTQPNCLGLGFTIQGITTLNIGSEEKNTERIRVMRCIQTLFKPFLHNLLLIYTNIYLKTMKCRQF